MEPIKSVTLAEAQEIVAAAEEKARQIGQPMNIAVAEVGGHLKSFARQEEAWLASVDIAVDKAFTAAALGVSTGELADMAQPGQPLFGINTTNGGRIVIFGGGIPLTRDGNVVGAVGVSGGTVDQDTEVAEAGVAVFE
ncbi:GlcG/HbpS family heme-binding protein [Rubrobacter aplysinae]|uniref:GlcG/HbpS family heme-binding protein n=1 Tax=Rubrobacter aplysinae TaxID=909625 RepID=UPI00064C0FCB|nr:heme-binding protein [Rubrobacter aplysinae]